MLPEIVYKVKKKLGCIFVESILLKSSDPTQNVTERSNDMETFIGGTSVGNVELNGIFSCLRLNQQINLV